MDYIGKNVASAGPDSAARTEAPGSVTPENGKSMRQETAKLLCFSNLQQTPAMVCFSHLRWDFVFQRPQHLLTRFAKHTKVYFIEEPIFDANNESSYMHYSERDNNVCVVTPHLNPGRSAEENNEQQEKLISKFLTDYNLENYMAWYYTPMALNFTRSIKPAVTIFDCMDELSMFAGAPPQLIENEKELLKKSDVVFTGGQSLYEAKKHRHTNIHAFPSSIEKEHFGKARELSQDPEDQKNIPGPRLGFFGVIDERMDINLLGEVARKRPDWHFVMLGPVVKIDPGTLPKESNIHYLGMKSYKELPGYISGWDVAMLPFALNESTKFISPTKTPEYLAGGRPVVSTRIKDVVTPYADKQLVHIADDADSFVTSVEKALAQKDDKQWLARVDEFLSTNSWDSTWEQMTHLICMQLIAKSGSKTN